MRDWLAHHPDIGSIRVAAADLNGQPRGKRIPVAAADKAMAGGTRFPYSVLNLDILGEDIQGSPLVLASGDQDGVLHPTARGPMPVPWLAPPAALLPLWMFHEDGSRFEGDPRHALARVLERYDARGLTPVCAVELEFFLIDDSGATFQVPPAPRSGRRHRGGDILSMRTLDQFDAFFNDLYAGCAAMDIPADTASSEGGMGQFEINLMHGPDALKAADDAHFFKMLAKGLARNHGFAASFMAKPYPDHAGSGLHVHFSILDAAGRNIFDDGGPKGSALLQHAVAGCLAAMPGTTLVFAPHANSYARLVPGNHAPTGIAWGYENRTVALRIPSGPPAARRIEHRTAGGDTNPYLLLAAILGAALNGVEDAAAPPDPINGNAYSQDLPQIPGDWSTAIDLFETDAAVARIFDPLLITNFTMTKRQELGYMADKSAEEQAEIYLGAV